MSISYFAALLLLGCIFTTSIGGIVRGEHDDGCSTPEFERCLNESSASSQLNQTEYLQAIFSFFCSNDACFSILAEYLACSGAGDAESLRRRCTRNDDGEFCEVRFVDGILSGDIPFYFDSCESASRICTTECRGNLTSISSYWGCCTATFENTTVQSISIPIPAREIFERCDVPLDEPCSGSYKTPMFLCMIIIVFLIVIII